MFYIFSHKKLYNVMNWPPVGILQYKKYAALSYTSKPSILSFKSYFSYLIIFFSNLIIFFKLYFSNSCCNIYTSHKDNNLTNLRSKTPSSMTDNCQSVQWIFWLHVFREAQIGNSLLQLTFASGSFFLLVVTFYERIKVM